MMKGHGGVFDGVMVWSETRGGRVIALIHLTIIAVRRQGVSLVRHLIVPAVGGEQ